MGTQGFHLRRAGLKLLAGALLVLPLSFSAAAAEDKKAEAFIEDLSRRVLNVLGDQSVDEPTRHAQFRTIFLDNIALKLFGRSALGPYARVATDAELAEYYKLLEDYAVETMYIRLQSYARSTIVVLSSDSQARGDVTYSFVDSDIKDSDGTKTAGMRWVLVSSPTSPFKLYDINVVTPNESGSFALLETQRAEFNSIITNNGRKVSALLDYLKTETVRIRQTGQAG